MYKKVLSGIVLFGMMNSAIFALPKSGEVIGRELNFYPLGWIGHIAMATGNNIFQPTNVIIEAMPGPGIQFNEWINFLNATPFWGAKYGLVGDAGFMYAGLVAAKLQSYWCPIYTATLSYTVGEGFLDGFGHPHPTICAKWRCDSLVSYIHAMANNPVLINNLYAPRVTFDMVPYYDLSSKKHNGSIKRLTPEEADAIYLKLKPKDVKNLSGEEIMTVVNIRNEDRTPERSQKDWELINSPEVNNAIKDLLLDAHSSMSEPDFIPKLLNIYNASKSEELNYSIIKATMFYYQGNWDAIKSSPDYEALKEFYAKALKSSKPEKQSSSIIVRGYIDFHDVAEIKANDALINSHLKAVGHKPAIGLEFELIRKSPSLEKQYFPKMINQLESNNNAEDEGMFVYLMNHGFIDNASIESKQLLKNHIEGIKKNPKANATDLDNYFNKESTMDFKQLEEKLK